MSTTKFLTLHTIDIMFRITGKFFLNVVNPARSNLYILYSFLFIFNKLWIKYLFSFYLKCFGFKVLVNGFFLDFFNIRYNLLGLDQIKNQ